MIPRPASPWGIESGLMTNEEKARKIVAGAYEAQHGVAPDHINVSTIDNGDMFCTIAKPKKARYRVRHEWTVTPM